MLPMKFNSNLDKLILDYVRELRIAVNEFKTPLEKEKIIDILDKYYELILKSTGIKIHLSVIEGSLNAHMQGMSAYGHSDTMLTNTWITRLSNLVVTRDKNKLPDFTIDLKRLKVSGELGGLNEMKVAIGLSFFHPKTGFTDAEITAILLHEIGHVFSALINLGNYVLLNHYLQEAAEVLQGQKPKNSKVKFISEEWIKETLTKEELGDFIYGKRNPKEATRVALLATRNLPRPHITGSNFTSAVREEQFADLFVSRFGLGKDLASGLVRIGKLWNITPAPRALIYMLYFTWIGASIASLGTIIPFLMLYASLQVPGTQLFTDQYRYDEEYERISKMKRDLIFQIKNESNPKIKKRLLDGIKEIEKLLEQVNKDPEYYYSMFRLYGSKYRKAVHQKQHEETLEYLVNNDLFVKQIELS